MARTQSQDYDKRRASITDHAAQLFAKYGFLGASIADLATACGASKSLVYHYFPSKEDVLYGVMSVHLDELVAISESVMADPKAKPGLRLERLTTQFIAAYVDAAASHKVLLNELDNLPADKRALIVDRQRRIIGTVSNLLIAIRPELGAHRDVQRPVSMLFFGMINWLHTWYEATGPVPPERLAQMVSEMMLAGLKKLSLDDQAS